MSNHRKINLGKDNFNGFESGKWLGNIPQAMFQACVSQLPGEYTKEQLIKKTRLVAEKQARIYFKGIDQETIKGMNTHKLVESYTNETLIQYSLKLCKRILANCSHSNY